MWGSFVIIKIYFSKRNIYGRQKINLIINFLKNEKIWILKTGAAEQVKQVKQLLHWNSEVLLQRNF